MDKEIILIIVSGVLTVAGFMGAFAINRLAKSIDGLVASDTAMQLQLAAHREDMVKNYVRHDILDNHKTEHKQALSEIKQDIVGRIDRMSMDFKEALYAHEHREMQAMFTQQGNSIPKGGV